MLEMEVSGLTVFAACYGGAGLLFLAATAEQLRQRRWPLARAVAVALPIGLFWPVTLAVMMAMKVLQPEG